MAAANFFHLTTLFIPLIAILFSNHLLFPATAKTDPLDHSSLQVLYKCLGSPPNLVGWSSAGGGDPCGEPWRGIACAGHFVISIKIPALGISGFLCSHISNFLSLRYLDMSHNNIGGEIPYGLPPNASHINLSLNNFTYRIPPSLPSLKFLNYLNVSHNSLSGPIGNVFTDMQSLEQLDLSFNHFTGDLPSSFGSLTRLRVLHLQHNELKGSVIILADLPLSVLYLQNNYFSGYLPVQFENIPHFRFFGNIFRPNINSTTVSSADKSSPSPVSLADKSSPSPVSSADESTPSPPLPVSSADESTPSLPLPVSSDHDKKESEPLPEVGLPEEGPGIIAPLLSLCVLALIGSQFYCGSNYERALRPRGHALPLHSTTPPVGHITTERTNRTEFPDDQVIVMEEAVSHSTLATRPSLPELLPSSSSVSETSTVQESEADVHSINIKGLPPNATPAQVEEEFKRFGPVEPCGVQVRSQKFLGNSVSQVEFEMASSVQSAIEASPMLFRGRKVLVEKQRAVGWKTV